ncbi:MAG: 2,3-bisphosphoglycerate-independent phosphoglycerate mutase [Candidatus Tyrphobacter sp.]
MKRRPLVLAVLDGWGCRQERHGNAIAAARTPHWDALLQRYAHTLLDASGEPVGLPKGIMGNSEVGHLNLGAGRVVEQGVTLIDEEIARGEFAKNETLRKALGHCVKSGGTLHLLGLLSDGCVHSSIAHLFALCDAAAAAHAGIAVHAFLDGRDVPPRSALDFVAQLQERLAKSGQSGAIASVCGRYYAMDRDKRWERTDAAASMLLRGQSPFHAASAREAIEAAYGRGEDDEFVRPTIVDPARRIEDGDACVFFNFRPDRARQLTSRFNEALDDGTWRDGLFATMTKYDETFPNAVLFGPRPVRDTFGDALSRAGLRQLRLAETEKYAHVTYFFNGGREEPLPKEERELVPSDRSVPTYDLAPKMRAKEITDFAIAKIGARAYDAIVMNYANADMVGHTGRWEPTIEAVETLDEQMARLHEAVDRAGGILAITADHGNAEEKIDSDGNPLTAHTTNPVPFLIADGNVRALADGGKLGDVAPTLLHLVGLPVPRAMTGSNLLAPC